MSKTKITDKTEIIEAKPEMLNYFYYKEVFNDEEIKDIILMCEKLDSEIKTDSYRNISMDEKRRNSVSYLPLNDETTWIYEKIYNLSLSANEEMGWNFDVDSIDSYIEYNTYSDNSGHYLWYSDISESNTNKLSVTLHLSRDDEYSGGKSEFNYGYEIIKPTFTVGDVVISPSYSLQRVTPILTGVKRTLTLNITGKPIK